MQIDILVNEYIAMRDAIAEKKKSFEDFKRDTKVKMATIELQLLDVSNSTGMNSFTTDSGTAYRTTKTYAKMLSADSRIEYAKSTGDYGLFTNHINKLHAIELIDDGFEPEALGITIESETVIQIRK